LTKELELPISVLFSVQSKLSAVCQKTSDTNDLCLNFSLVILKARGTIAKYEGMFKEFLVAQFRLHTFIDNAARLEAHFSKSPGKRV
jgi:hypothetical protein